VDKLLDAKSWADLEHAGLPQEAIEYVKSKGHHTPARASAYVAHLIDEGVWG
jgi:hypothetical protein